MKFKIFSRFDDSSLNLVGLSLVITSILILGGLPLDDAFADDSLSFILKWGDRGSGDGQFISPSDVAIDSSGNVYVVDNGNNRIQKFDTNGIFLTTWGSLGSNDAQFNQPISVEIDSSGNVYVVDFSNHRIQKFDANGTFLTTWGSLGSGDGQFNGPHGLEVDSSGNVYVTDQNNNRIQKFDANGTFLTTWGSNGSGDGQFDTPRGVVVDSSGNVYVADTDNNRIQKFDANGTFLTTWGSLGSGDGQFNFPKTMAFDSSGNVYVTDQNNNRIQKFDGNGTFLTKLDYNGSGDGQLAGPQSVEVDSSGNVYVADTNNHRIQVFGDFASSLEFDRIINDNTFDTSTSEGNFSEWELNAFDGNISIQVICDNPSGSVFPIGTTTTTCTATDYAGNTISMSFDTTFVLTVDPPLLVVPTDETITLGSDGFVGWYSLPIVPTATSTIDGTITPTCTDSSNDEIVYPIYSSSTDTNARYEIAITEGIHTITCTATDSTENAITDSYTVTFINSGISSGPAVSFDTVSDIFVETTNTAGEVVTFANPVSYDAVSGTNITSTCTPASGTLFAVAQTMITCTATNSAGSSSEVKFMVNVNMKDTKPRGIFLDTELIPIPSTDSNGSVFDFKVHYYEPLDNNLIITCNPPSGSKFPIGTTTVTCTTNKTPFASSHSKSFLVNIYDSAKIQKTQSKTSISLSEQPQAIAVNSKTNTFYVATINPFTNTSNVHFIDGTTHTITNSVPINSLIEEVDVNLATNTVYAVDDNTLYIIDGNSKTLKTQLELATNRQANAEKITIDPIKNIIFVGGPGLNNGIYVDRATVAVNGNTNQIMVGNESNPVGPDLYFESSTNKIYTIFSQSSASYYDGTTYRWEHNSVVITADRLLHGDRNEHEFAYMPSTKKLYTNSYQNEVISIIDFDSRTSETINVTKPIDIDINSKTNQLFVVSDVTPGVVTIFDDKRQIVKTVTVGSKPIEIAVNDVTDVAYVLNQGDSTISIIGEAPQKPRPPVPDWLKTNVEWWADGKIDDKSFKDGISFMIKENIIVIDNLPTSSGASEYAIPEWVKQNAKWWADGTIGEDEFIGGLKYMVEKGIINVN